MTKKQIETLMIQNGVEPDVMFLPSDICYNRTNAANLLSFKDDVHLFKYVKRNTYQLLGENYPYTGYVEWKPSGQPITYVAGEWAKGQITAWYPEMNKTLEDAMREKPL